jgi:predicted ArsR family transcriptional regulator
VAGGTRRPVPGGRLRNLMDAVHPTGATASRNVTRQAVLIALRREGPLSPDRLAGVLGVSRTAVLQQLRRLAAGGLVARRTERHGVGRPRHLYELTATAQEVFPADYGALAADMLSAMEAFGGRELVERVFALRRERLRDQLVRRLDDAGLSGAPLEDRVREVARFQDEQGYLCDCRRETRAGEELQAGTGEGLEPIAVDAEGVIRLREHNCAIYDVATATPAACRAEVQLFREVLGARVVRETHIAAGDRCCTYRIEERRAEA